MDYAVRAQDLAPYLARVNRLLAAKGFGPLSAAQLTGQINQLKAFIDLCHLYGIAVISDVVYNHAGGGFDDQSINFFDRQPYTSDNNSLYFTDQDHAGGRVFAFRTGGAAVPHRQRQVAVAGVPRRRTAVRPGDRHRGNGGWYFAQDLTTRCASSSLPPSRSPNIGNERWKGVDGPPHGMGFDIGYSDALRDALREVIAATTGGRDARVNLDRLRDALYLTHKESSRWTVFQCIENHDLLDFNHSGRDRQPRIASLADPIDCTLLVRAQPREGGDRTSADGAGGPDDLHGPGVPRGQVLDGLARAGRNC